MRPSVVTVGIGDIHGRFRRVDEWIRELEASLGRAVDLVFAVGDVEAFHSANHHGRKAAKRSMPAEFAEYVKEEARLTRPIHFIGGNNEDFASLHAFPQGTHLGAQLHYLGRSGVAELGGLRVAFLSGIYAPTHFAAPVLEPTSQERRKQAGYFREPEVNALSEVADIDLMLVHEWPKGLIKRRDPSDVPLRADKFPWVGNAMTRRLAEKLAPKWLFCGHSHVPFASTLSHPDGKATHVACLDQAVHSKTAVFWIEWSGRGPLRAGWGTDGQPAWQAGETWGRQNTPVF